MEWERLTPIEQFVFFLRIMLALCLILFAAVRGAASRRAAIEGDHTSALIYRNHAILSLLLVGIGLIANLTDIAILLNLVRDVRDILDA